MTQREKVLDILKRAMHGTGRDDFDSLTALRESLADDLLALIDREEEVVAWAAVDNLGEVAEVWHPGRKIITLEGFRQFYSEQCGPHAPLTVVPLTYAAPKEDTDV